MHNATVDFAPKAELFGEGSERLAVDEGLHPDPRLNKYYSVYNRDGRYYTPAFLMGRDLRAYIDHPGYDYENFREKIQEVEKRNADELKDGKGVEILVPRPTGSKCQVCHHEVI